MEIIFSIIHEISKEKNSTVTSVNWRNDLLNLEDEKTYNTVKSALSVIGNEDNRVLYGIFSSNERVGRIPRESLDFFDKIQNGQEQSVLIKEFIKLSKTSVAEIQTQIIEPASYKMSTGGYLLFTLHKSSNNKFFFSCMMIKKQNGIAIDDNLNIIESIHINLQKLMQSFSLNLSQYFECDNDIDNETYLKFIGSNKNSEPSSDYFIRAFGCETGTKANIVTRDLIKAVRHFTNSLSDENEWFKPFKDQPKNTIIDYLGSIGINQSAELKVILLKLNNVLKDISLSNNKDSDFFDKKVNVFIDDLQKDKDDGGYGIPNTFHISSNVVKQYTRVKLGSQSNWQLDFKLALLGYTPDSEIYLDEESRQLSIKISRR